MIITFLIAPTEGKCHPTELLIPRSYRNPTRGEFDIGMVGREFRDQNSPETDRDRGALDFYRRDTWMIFGRSFKFPQRCVSFRLQQIPIRNFTHLFSRIRESEERSVRNRDPEIARKEKKKIEKSNEFERLAKYDE